jgi:ABC-type sugar transport system substrate-binding protein
MGGNKMKSGIKVGALAAFLVGLGMSAATAKDVTIGVSFDKIEPFRVAEKKAIEDAVAAVAQMPTRTPNGKPRRSTRWCQGA